MSAAQTTACIVTDASLLDDERLSPSLAAAFRDHHAARVTLEINPADDAMTDARERAYLAAQAQLSATAAETWADLAVKIGALFEAGGNPHEAALELLLTDARRLLDEGRTPPAPTPNIDDMHFEALATQDELTTALRSHDDWRASLGVVLSFSTFDRPNIARVMRELEAGAVPDFTPKRMLDTIHDLREHFRDTLDFLDAIAARVLIGCMDASGLKSADVFGTEAA